MEDKQTSDWAPKYIGYTVNGRIYNIPQNEVRNIPEGSEGLQEDWLKQQGHIVVEQLPEFGNGPLGKKDVCEQTKRPQ